jgi:universal stress protein E
LATKIRRVLVAVRDLGHAPRNELRKAADIARAAGARVELFHAVDLPVDTGTLAGRSAASARTRSIDASLQRSQHRLQRYARLALFQGLKVECLSNCDYPPHEAVVRRALAWRADLVIAASRSHGTLRRLLLRNTDWELIRQCPCPLLLVKSPRPYSGAAVLAAIDPFHTHSKPAALDMRLLEMGQEWARLFESGLHVFHAYLPLTSISPMPSGPSVPLAPPPEVEDAHGELIAREFDRLAQRGGVPPNARHLHMGDTSGELCALARRIKAGLLVMGAVSRSGLRRIFIGNTAEKVLDEITTDVLIVKPRGFRTPVPAKAPGNRGLPSRSSS